MDKINILKQKVVAIEEILTQRPFVILEEFNCNERKLHLALTERLHMILKKNRLWLSNDFLITLKNAEYGFDPHYTRSHGGRDGIFIVEKNYKPRNNMIKKLYDGFIEKPESGIREIALLLGVKIENLKAVRLVSHHMRLLGLFLEKRLMTR